MNSATDRNMLFATRDQRLLAIWDEIQRVQTDFCFAQEVSAYYYSEHWIHNVKTVLDVGTGNGYFLSKLQTLFPEKDYTGIDTSREFIGLAQAHLGSSGVQLKTRDYFNVTGVYDFVIMRLFWQHLPNSRLEEALNKLTEITKPGSSVLISDAYDEVRYFLPALPEFRKIIAAYTNQQKSARRNRDIVTTLRDWAESMDLWRVGCDLPLILPSSIPGYLHLFGRIYELWLDLFEVLNELDIDFTPARKELKHWRDNAGAYTQAGLHVMRIDRIA
ncbi:MAG: class I SAM-dependent methyltransferase [Desulfosarcina sp.]|nr:class I SAM-dependent methyltransferase [Desulfobacterales bacterium]